MGQCLESLYCFTAFFLSSIPHCLTSLVMSSVSSLTLLIFQSDAYILGPLHYQMNFRSNFRRSQFLQKATEIFGGIASNLIDQFK